MFQRNEGLCEILSCCLCHHRPQLHRAAAEANVSIVAARQGCYHDAIAVKKNTVIALISEEFGGVAKAVTACVAFFLDLRTMVPGSSTMVELKIYCVTNGRPAAKPTYLLPTFLDLLTFDETN